MNRLLLILIAALTAAGTAGADAARIEREITVEAAPLQAWRAMCVGWQMKFWLGADIVISEVRAEGPWRITWSNRLEEGIYREVIPGESLVFDIVAEEGDSRVSVTFDGTPEGTDLHVIHISPADVEDPDEWKSRSGDFWDRRLSRLANYLNRIAGAYFVRPPGDDPVPAVLVLHDRFGLNRTVRNFCDSLALSGFAALAVDMFKGDVTSDLTQAARYLELVNDEESIRTARRGQDYLKSREDIRENRIAVWGMGYGGSLAAALAATTPNLRACADWYGADLPSDNMLSRIACPVLGIFGDLNLSAPDPVIRDFDLKLRQAAVKVKTITLLGNRAFADPAYGTGYNQKSVYDAWRHTHGFFLEHLMR